MPLPNAPDYSQRIYELLKETDLENLSYAQFQAVAEKIFIEPENEDEMRRLVLVQLARMAVRGDWDGFLSGGGGSAAPADAEYLLAYDGSVPAELTAARKLTVGNNISMAHGAGANDDMTISATPGGADGQIQYNVAGVLSATGLLSTNKTNELTIVAISGDGRINISSSSKAVSLLCDENQKLKVKGATDSFVFDVSSSSGGIQFPDGSVQSTAASGGSSSDFNLQLPATEINSGNNDLFVISRQPGWGSPFSSTGSIASDSGIVKFYPWIAPKTGDIDKIYINIRTDGTGDVEMAVFSDSDGVPDSKIGGEVSYTGGTGGTGSEPLTPASTISITKGTQYWIAVFIDSGTIQLTSEDAAQGYIAAPRFSGSTGALLSVNVHGVKLESQSSIPSSVTASNLGSESDAQPRWGITYA